MDPLIKGIILLGFSGNDMASTVEWQLFKRVIENFVATDLDTNHDGYVTKEEAAPRHSGVHPAHSNGARQKCCSPPPQWRAGRHPGRLQRDGNTRSSPV